MKTIIKSGLAAMTAAASLVAAAEPASAHEWGDGYYGYQHDNSTGAAIVGGVIGLALGAALASSGNHSGYYSSGYGYAPSYGGYGGYSSYPGYGYGNGYGSSGYGDYYGSSGYGGYNGYSPRYSYRQCISRRSVWNPYYGGYTVERYQYAC